MIEKQSDKIINMCSMISVSGRKTVFAYASAKGGLKLLIQSMTCLKVRKSGRWLSVKTTKLCFRDFPGDRLNMAWHKGLQLLPCNYHDLMR